LLEDDEHDATARNKTSFGRQKQECSQSIVQAPWGAVDARLHPVLEDDLRAPRLPQGPDMTTPITQAAAMLCNAAAELKVAAEELERGALTRADARIHAGRVLAKDASAIVKQALKNRRARTMAPARWRDAG
jgi:hypothetical protein